MLCSTNTLSKQYDETFSELAKHNKYIMIKGANNYPCSALSQNGEEENAESCAWYSMVKSSEFADTICNHCDRCEFLNVKKRKNTIRHLTTNYSYFFVDRMYTGKFEERDLVVWDEAHLINDLFSEHNAIYFSQKRMLAIAKELSETLSLVETDIAKTVMAIANDCTKKDKINETNYRAYLLGLQKVYEYAKTRGEAEAEKALRANSMKRYTSMNKFVRKYEGLSCKISDFFTYEYDHVFENKEDEESCSVKPVFVGAMMETLQCSNHNLFMSATISKNFLERTLQLVPDKTKFIKLEPTFPRENKEVVFFDPLSLNFTSLKNPDTVKALRKNVFKIVNKHVNEGDRGIILTPSFKLQNELVDEIKSLATSGKMKLFEHVQGTKLEITLASFKSYTGDLPAVLISPSIFEGIDLPGKLSKFQILVKAPFPSLGDKRMKYILDRYPDIYQQIMIMKAVQGAGRSVRSETDSAVTYCTDQNLSRAWGSNANIWQDEFNTRFTRFI